MRILAVTINGNIDLGQLIIAGLVGFLSFIGWFIKREVTTVNSRLSKHDEALVNLAADVQRLIGYYYGLKGITSGDNNDHSITKSR